jgi:hypothetical protein
MYADGLRFPTVSALLEFAQEQGLGRRTEMQILAAACGLLETDGNGWIALSETAKVIVQLKPEVRPDLIHYLLYTGWEPENPSANTILWSYREITDSLWKKSSVNVLQIANVIAEEVRNRTQQAFIGIPGYDSGSVSFSPKSTRGVRKWLEAVVPPVIENDVFARRHFCPPELTLLSTGWVAQTMGGEIGIDFLLTPERREAICRVCLLEPPALDRVLDWMLPLCTQVIQPGTGAGVYGRFLHFLNWPQVGDLLQ